MFCEFVLFLTIFYFWYLSFSVATAVSATWAFWSGYFLLERVSSSRARGNVLKHLTLMEGGLWAVGELTGAQNLCLSLCIRASSWTCRRRQRAELKVGVTDPDQDILVLVSGSSATVNLVLMTHEELHCWRDGGLWGAASALVWVFNPNFKTVIDSLNSLELAKEVTFIKTKSNQRCLQIGQLC